MDILTSLYNSYDKVLIVNLANDTFKEIKVNEHEKVNYQGLNQWLIQLANSEDIHPSDKTRFLEFANINNFSRYLEYKNNASIFYQCRRPGASKYEWHMMEIFKTDVKDNILLIVKNINEAWLSIDQLKYREKIISRTLIRDYLASKLNKVASCGIIMFEYNPEDKSTLDAIFNKYYDNSFDYDDSHKITVLTDRTAGEFQRELSRAYKYLEGININIGSNWKAEEWDPQEMIIAAATNLQVNRKNSKTS